MLRVTYSGLLFCTRDSSFQWSLCIWSMMAPTLLRLALSPEMHKQHINKHKSAQLQGLNNINLNIKHTWKQSKSFRSNPTYLNHFLSSSNFACTERIFNKDNVLKEKFMKALIRILIWEPRSDHLRVNLSGTHSTLRILLEHSKVSLKHINSTIYLTVLLRTLIFFSFQTTKINQFKTFRIKIIITKRLRLDKEEI